MKLAVVTKPTFFIEEDKIITRLFEEELDYLFLDKSYPHPQYIERLLNLIPKKYHKRIFTCNNRLMQDYKLAGQLFPPGSPHPTEKQSGKLVGYAANLKELYEFKGFYEIMCFGPMGRTFHQSAELNEYGKKVINKRVWAFGDIDEGNLKRLASYGFGGVILDAQVWNRFDSCRSTDYSELMDSFKKIQKLAKKL
jgi:thiamine-phosphate pyrophosphorylase